MLRFSFQIYIDIDFWNEFDVGLMEQKVKKKKAKDFEGAE